MAKVQVDNLTHKSAGHHFHTAGRDLASLGKQVAATVSGFGIHQCRVADGLSDVDSGYGPAVRAADSSIS